MCFLNTFIGEHLFGAHMQITSRQEITDSWKPLQ